MVRRYVNNRGLASIVSVVVLVLLVVVAVALLTGLIMKLVDTPRLSPLVDCLSAQQSPPVLVQAACYNRTTGTVVASVVVRQASVTNFMLTTRATSFVCGEGCGLCQLGAMNEAVTYYFPFSTNPEYVQSSVAGCVLQTISVHDCS